MSQSHCHLFKKLLPIQKLVLLWVLGYSALVGRPGEDEKSPSSGLVANTELNLILLLGHSINLSPPVQQQGLGLRPWDLDQKCPQAGLAQQ